MTLRRLRPLNSALPVTVERRFVAIHALRPRQVAKDVLDEVRSTWAPEMTAEQASQVLYETDDEMRGRELHDSIALVAAAKAAGFEVYP